MNVGEQIDVRIQGKSDNYGVARISDNIIFVTDTNKGDYVRVKIKKIIKGIIYAEVIADLEPGTNKDYDDEDETYPDEIIKQYEE
jgi:predicted RNA-binding protein with TRAM domain